MWTLIGQVVCANRRLSDRTALQKGDVSLTYYVTSAKDVMFLPVCISIYPQDNSKGFQRILMKFLEGKDVWVTITVLGVTFNSVLMLSFAPRVQKVASKAAASLYALRMLKAHGLGWPSITGSDAGDPGGPVALCKLGMEWVCQVGGKNNATVDSKQGISLWFFTRVFRNYRRVIWIIGWHLSFKSFDRRKR